MATLFVVATPIGNLQDMTPRAIDVLKTVALIAAEDTRVTSRLLNVFHIHTPLTSCHQHNEAEKGKAIAERMHDENIDVALTTDAGTPGISDPGYGLTAACVSLGIPVIAIPGACAMAAALSVSALDTREFAFYGFLPREKKALREKLHAVSKGVPVAVVHESPFRVLELMEMLAQELPDTRVSVSCDLTKKFELTLRGSPCEVLETMQKNPKAEKGEYCIVLDFHNVPKEAQAKAAEISLEAELVEAMLTGLSLFDAQKALAEKGRKKNAVYQAALRVKELMENDA